MLASAKEGERFQLERVGFFIVDEDTKPGAVVLNRTVPLKDSFPKTGAVERPARETKPARERTEKAPVSQVPVELSPVAQTLKEAHELTPDVARILSQDTVLLDLFAAAIAGGKDDAKTVASLLVNDVLGEIRAKKLESTPFSGASIAELAGLVKSGAISSAQTKEVLAEMFSSGKAPKAIVAEKGLAQIATADALAPAIDKVLVANADAVARYRGGNKNVFGALVGMVMKATGGRANPKLLKELLEKALES